MRDRVERIEARRGELRLIEGPAGDAQRALHAAALEVAQGLDAVGAPARAVRASGRRASCYALAHAELSECFAALERAQTMEAAPRLAVALGWAELAASPERDERATDRGAAAAVRRGWSLVRGLHPLLAAGPRPAVCLAGVGAA